MTVASTQRMDSIVARLATARRSRRKSIEETDLVADPLENERHRRVRSRLAAALDGRVVVRGLIVDPCEHCGSPVDIPVENILTFEERLRRTCYACCKLGRRGIDQPEAEVTWPDKRRDGVLFGLEVGKAVEEKRATGSAASIARVKLLFQIGNAWLLELRPESRVCVSPPFGNSGICDCCGLRRHKCCICRLLCVLKYGRHFCEECDHERLVSGVEILQRELGGKK